MIQHHDDATGPKKQQPFEERMIECVKECCSKRKGSQDGQAAPFKNQGQSQSYKDQPNIFDAAVGEQPFERMFRQRIQNAQHGSYDAGNQNQISPPDLRCSQDIECQPDKSINRYFQHHG